VAVSWTSSPSCPSTSYGRTTSEAADPTNPISQKVLPSSSPTGNYPLINQKNNKIISQDLIKKHKTPQLKTYCRKTEQNKNTRKLKIAKLKKQEGVQGTNQHKPSQGFQVEKGFSSGAWACSAPH